ncbi:MAG TPA: addiction module protein [Arachnia sp.]|nr:addiction module protein [Arachnia sp.]
MALRAEDVYQAGLELDLDERTIVVHRLLASLHPGDGSSEAEIDAKWRDEVGARLDDILTGRVELVSFEETRAKTRALLNNLRP